MLLWFVTLALLGLWQIMHRPEILASLLPWHGVEFFQRHGLHGFLILGSVVLVVTGGEALYADMGHFGLQPIRNAWLIIVMPSLVLAYLGQGAVLLGNPAMASNPFYALVPAGPATYALVVLSSLATIIASQALISGALSLTRQAMLLGFLPRVTIRHTAYESEGQIYIPEVNVMLAVGCIALVLAFRESMKLAAAYGLAVTGTMVMTTILFYLVIRYAWGWRRLPSLAVLFSFLAVDIPFLVANLFKFFDGGYVPMLIGASLLAAMLIWSRGRTAVMEHYARQHGPFETEWPQLQSLVVARVPGTAVFLATSNEHLSPVLVHHIRSTRALHEAVVLLTVADSPQPEVPMVDRATVKRLPDGFYRIATRFGYMEQPLLMPTIRETAATKGLPIDLDAATFFIGHSTIVTDRGRDWAFIPEAMFAYLQRNAVREDQRYGLPAERVMEIGEQIAL